MLPRHWQTPRLRIDDVAAAEVEDLRAVFNASADVGPMDPTFRVVAPGEIGELVARGARTTDDERGFRMQAFRPSGEGGIAGYYHLTEAQPRPDLVWLSMFVVRPEMRRQGFGREIAAALIERLAEQRENRAVWARVYVANRPALAFWTGLGFTRIVEHRDEHVHVEGAHASLVLERALAPFFERARAALEPALRELGFALAVEHRDHAGFGSAYLEYRRRGSRLRLVWDGKDEVLRAEAAPSQLEHWTDVEARAGARPLAPDRGRDEARIARLRAAIEEVAGAVVG